MDKTLEERITAFNETKNEIQKLSEEGEDFDYSIPMEMMETASEIITELQEQNKAWQGMVESTCQTNKALCERLKEGADAFYSQKKKLDEALAKVEIAKEALEFIADKERPSGNLTCQIIDAREKAKEALEQLNKQGEKHE